MSLCFALTGLGRLELGNLGRRSRWSLCPRLFCHALSGRRARRQHPVVASMRGRSEHSGTLPNPARTTCEQMPRWLGSLPMCPWHGRGRW